MPEVVLTVRRPFEGSDRLANSQVCKSTSCQPYAGLHRQLSLLDGCVFCSHFEEVVDPPRVD